MIIGIWNIDCPAQPSTRFDRVKRFIESQNCDLLILTEVNSCLRLKGYNTIFSQESPFHNKSRNYSKPNKYHQVGIYAKNAIKKHTSSEPTNGLLCEMQYQEGLLYIYGSVITIKDRWADWSSLTYSDRVDEQISQIKTVMSNRCFIGGDFNFRIGTSYNKYGFDQMSVLVDHSSILWPTRQESRTVQHILHTKDLMITYSIGEKNGNLSDHPFLKAECILAEG